MGGLVHKHPHWCPGYRTENAPRVYAHSCGALRKHPCLHTHAVKRNIYGVDLLCSSPRPHSPRFSAASSDDAVTCLRCIPTSGITRERPYVREKAAGVSVDRLRSMRRLTDANRSTASQPRTDLLEPFSRLWAGPGAFNDTDVRRPRP